MTTPDDIESRLSAVERDLARVREQQQLTASDAAAARRVLSAGADHDVSEVRAELRAHTRALNALRETQVEQGRRLDSLESRVDRGFAQIGGRLEQVDGRLERMDGRFEQIDGRFADMDRRFTDMDRGFATTAAATAQIITLLEGLADT